MLPCTVVCIANTRIIQGVLKKNESSMSILRKPAVIVDFKSGTKRKPIWRLVCLNY